MRLRRKPVAAPQSTLSNREIREWADILEQGRRGSTPPTRSDFEQAQNAIVARDQIITRRDKEISAAERRIRELEAARAEDEQDYQRVRAERDTARNELDATKRGLADANNRFEAMRRRAGVLDERLAARATEPEEQA